MNFNFPKHFYKYFIILLVFSGCELKEPTAPEWNIGLNLPFSKETYNIYDIINRSENIGTDSSDNDIVFLYGRTDYKRKFGEDIKFDGYPETQVKAVTNLLYDTSLVIDDSTFISKSDFLNGELKFDFSSESGSEVFVSGVIKNLFRNSDKDTARISVNLNGSNKKTVVFNLQDYYIRNDNPDNTIKLKIIFSSADPVQVNFIYSMSEYSIRSFTGRLKPLNTGISTDEVIDPFGSDVPEGVINFSYISPNKNFLVLKKYSDLFQVDFSHISIVGENKNGRQVRLKYLKNGNPGDLIDTIFTLRLESEMDSVAYPINENNSNILEFINNIPVKITLMRDDVLNSVYKEGTVKYTDSLLINLLIQVPLDISVTEPVVFSDTSDAGITDEELRNQLDNVSEFRFTFISDNHFPLKAVAKILILDSSYVPLIAISKIIGQNNDSTITVDAASVGDDGLVNNSRSTVFSAVLTGESIGLLKHMGKIIYDYKLYTEPSLIPPSRTTVKITGSNQLKLNSFGKVVYRIQSN